MLIEQSVSAHALGLKGRLLSGWARTRPAKANPIPQQFRVPTYVNLMEGDFVVNFKIEGSVASGLGRGAQFLGLEWVRSQLREKLSLDPYPGTLNLVVRADGWSALYARRKTFLKIADPSASNCPGFLKSVVLRGEEFFYPSAYLILPELTMYKDVLEIIAAENLREKLRLKDGDRVSVEEVEESEPPFDKLRSPSGAEGRP